MGLLQSLGSASLSLYSSLMVCCTALALPTSGFMGWGRSRLRGWGRHRWQRIRNRGSSAPGVEAWNMSHAMCNFNFNDFWLFQPLAHGSFLEINSMLLRIFSINSIQEQVWASSRNYKIHQTPCLKSYPAILDSNKISCTSRESGLQIEMYEGNQNPIMLSLPITVRCRLLWNMMSL